MARKPKKDITLRSAGEPQAPPSPTHTPRQVFAAAVSEALNDTKKRLIAIWHRLPLWVHLVILTMVLLGVVAWRYQDFLSRHWRVIRVLPRVAFEASNHVPLSKESATAVRNAVDVLEREGVSDLAASARFPPIAGYEAWPAAQAIVSTGIPQADVFVAVEKQKDTTCHCWPQFSNLPPNIAATAWVLRAYALARRNPGELELQFLLSQQRDGAFPLYHNTQDHSTFATALAVLALYDLIRSGTLTPQQRLQCSVALDWGVAFLRGSNYGNRWRYYPARADSNSSDADSGLVLYTLHYVGKGDRRLDKLWLDSLPRDRLSSRDDEISNTRWLYPADQLKPPVPDSIRHLRLPWIIAATDSAYPSGSTWQRAKAVALLEEVFTKTDDSSLVPPENFKRAELLIALKHLEHSSTSK
jgi:hypothetical protein